MYPLADYAFIVTHHAPAERSLSAPPAWALDNVETGVATAVEYPLAGGVQIHISAKSEWVRIHFLPADIWGGNNPSEDAPPYYLPPERVASNMVGTRVGVESLQSALVVSSKTTRFVVFLPIKVFERLRQYAPNHERSIMVGWKRVQ